MDADILRQRLAAANALMRTGDMPGAEQAFRELVLEGPPLGRGLALEGLGRVLSMQGRAEEGLNAMRDALALLRSVAGTEHPATLGVLQNTARMCLLAGNAEESVQLGREAVESLVRLHGENAREVAGARIRLSSALYALGDFDGAEEATRTAMTTLEICDPQSMDMATCLNNLGRIYEERGNAPAGIEYHERSVVLRRALLGAHPETAFALGNLGVALASAGRWQEACSNLEEALTCYQSLGLEQGPDAEGCRANLAVCKRAMDEA